MELILFAAGLGIGFYLGAKFMKLFERSIIEAALKDLGVTNEQMIAATARMREKIRDEQGIVELEVKIEQHGDVFYLYRKDTDEFIVQGRSLEEIQPVLLKRFGSVRLVADKADSGHLLERMAK